MNLLVKETAMELRAKTRISCLSNNAVTPTGGRKGWMDTYRGASREGRADVSLLPLVLWQGTGRVVKHSSRHHDRRHQK